MSRETEERIVAESQAGRKGEGGIDGYKKEHAMGSWN